jgi:hypothetical protein
MVHASHPSYAGGISGRIEVQASLLINVRPYPKIGLGI